MHTRRAASVLIVIALAAGGLAGETDLASRSSAGSPFDSPRGIEIDQGGSDPGEHDQAPWLRQLRSYLEAVRGHAPGAADAAARRIAIWTERDLNEARADFFRLVTLYRRQVNRRSPPPASVRVMHKATRVTLADLRAILGLVGSEADGGDVSGTLRRAALLHADIAMLVTPRLSGWHGCVSRSSLLVLDGNTVGSGCINFHWSQARLLLDGVRPGPAEDPFVRLWYLATTSYMLEVGDYADAEPQLERGTALFPSDPAVQFVHGFHHEALAAPFVQAAAAESKSEDPGAGAHLEDAEASYRKAVREDPGFAEARVHRGRVLTLLGRHRDAAEELRLASGLEMGPRLRYFCELFLGRTEEVLGNRAEARDRYERASSLYREAQSPLLALAFLSRRAGDRPGAQEAMRKVLVLPVKRGDQADPWWTYSRVQDESAGPRLARLRAPFLEEGTR